jgi:hypothetical protein
MAYQLIYTSAPRALEAGRSGFGTVARHREISSQLVTVLERVSQFSRLPGSNINRVIFSHRIITLAGARYHVLSSIRDAGADYTGRTNHIAHHLVVSSREIAQLGAACPSPAEILSFMPWATSWPEAPRFLGSDEEVSLAAFPRGQSTGAWAALTGNPEHAWILVTGEAARGAYLVHPARADLLRLFDESLQLSPDRLWQIAFTTSLQPSDEVSDFRWIGIESDSPLRNQAEGAGRIAFNLDAPSSLPHVEYAPAIPSPATPTTVPVQSAPNTPDGINLVPELHGTTPSSFPQQSVPGTAPQTTTHQAYGGVAQKAAPTSGKLNLLWPALVALLLVGLGIFQFDKIKKREFEDEITAALTPLKEDYPEVLNELKKQVYLNNEYSRKTIIKLAELIKNFHENLQLEELEIETELKEFESFREKNTEAVIPKYPNEILNYLKSLREIEKISSEHNPLKVEQLKEVLEGHCRRFPNQNFLILNSKNKIPKAIVFSTKRIADALILKALFQEEKPSKDQASFEENFVKKISEATGISAKSNKAKDILKLWQQTNENAVQNDLLSKCGGEIPPWLKNEIEKVEAANQKKIAASLSLSVKSESAPAIPHEQTPQEHWLHWGDLKRLRFRIPSFSPEKHTISVVSFGNERRLVPHKDQQGNSMYGLANEIAEKGPWFYVEKSKESNFYLRSGKGLNINSLSKIKLIFQEKTEFIFNIYIESQASEVLNIVPLFFENGRLSIQKEFKNKYRGSDLRPKFIGISNNLDNGISHFFPIWNSALVERMIARNMIESLKGTERQRCIEKISDLTSYLEKCNDLPPGEYVIDIRSPQLAEQSDELKFVPLCSFLIPSYEPKPKP